MKPRSGILEGTAAHRGASGNVSRNVRRSGLSRVGAAATDVVGEGGDGVLDRTHRAALRTVAARQGVPPFFALPIER